MKKRLNVLENILLVFVVAASLIAVALTAIGALLPEEETFFQDADSALAQNVVCYGRQGGAKKVAGSGCEYEFQSGSTLDIMTGTNVIWNAPFPLIGDLTITGNLTVTVASNLVGNISSGTGPISVTDNLVLTGQADAIQMAVTGYTTQTSNLFVLEQSDGTDVLVVDNDGNLSSATSAITVTDNVAIVGQADAIQLTVSGFTTQTNYLVTLEQSDGSDVLTVSNTGDLVVSNTVRYGPDDNYPLGYALSAQEISCGTATFTGTDAVATTLSTATYVIATLITDPAAGAGDPYMVTADAPSTSSITLNVWQDDATAATSASTVDWCAIGNE